MSWTPETLKDYLDAELRCLRAQLAAAECSSRTAIARADTAIEKRLDGYTDLAITKVSRVDADRTHGELIEKCDRLQRQIDGIGKPNYSQLIAAAALLLALITGIGGFVYSSIQADQAHLDAQLTELARDQVEHHASPGHVPALERTEALAARLRILEQLLRPSIPGEGTSRGGSRSPPDDRP